MKKWIRDERGYAIVEATLVFPIIILIFMMLILLSLYLPTRATLQHATQYAATALATERSDTWLFFDEQKMEYTWETKKDNLSNVYVDFFKSMTKGKGYQSKAEEIVRNREKMGLSMKSGELKVECEIVNRLVYKEVRVTATRTIPIVINFIFFKKPPRELAITVTSTAVVQNADEFVRNIDIAKDFVKYLADYAKEKYKLEDTFESVSKIGSKFSDALGWN